MRQGMHPFEPIGIIESCFKEKFGIPRQPGLVPAAKATLILKAPYNQTEALTGLEDFSHIWLIYIFHGVEQGKWKPTVRPPRLGGNRRTGVFATRSNFRPNPIGLSVVKLERIIAAGADVRLELSGVDLLEGTPVLDIKPYLPYADGIADAKGGFAPDAPERCLAVEFTPEARVIGQQLDAGPAPGILDLIEQVLKLDPRPAYIGDSSSDRVYGFRIMDFDVKWRIEGGNAIIMAIEQVA